MKRDFAVSLKELKKLKRTMQPHKLKYFLLIAWAFLAILPLSCKSSRPEIIRIDYQFLANRAQPLPILQSGHLPGSQIQALQYSPDGKYLASGADDRTVKIWDLANKKIVASFKHHDEVLSVAFSNTGKYIFSTTKDAIFSWSIETKKRVEKKRAFYYLMHPIVIKEKIYYYAMNGSKLVWVVHKHGKIQSINPYDKYTFSKGIAISHDQKWIAINEYSKVHILSRETLKLKATIKIGHWGTIAFSQDGKYIIACTGSHISKFPIDGGKKTDLIDFGYYAYVDKIQASPNGKYLAAINKSSNLILWAPPFVAASKKSIKTKTGLLAMDIDPSGQYAAVGGSRGKIFIYNLRDHKMLMELKTNILPIEEFSQVSRRQTVGLNLRPQKGISLFSLRSGAMITKHIGSSLGHILKMDLDRNGRYIAVSSSKKTHLYYVRNKRFVHDFGNTGYAYFDSFGKFLITTFSGWHRINFYNLFRKKEVFFFSGEPQRFSELIFAANARAFAHGSYTRSSSSVISVNIYTYSRESGSLKRHYSNYVAGYLDPVMDLSPNGRYVVMGSKSGEISVLNIQTDQSLWRPAVHQYARFKRVQKIKQVAFLKNNKDILVSRKNDVYTCDLQEKNCSETYPSFAFKAKGSVKKIILSPDRSRYMIWTDKNHLFTVEPGTYYREFIIQSKFEPNQIGFSRDNQILLMGSQFGLHLWHLKHKKKILMLWDNKANPIFIMDGTYFSLPMTKMNSWISWYQGYKAVAHPSRPQYTPGLYGYFLLGKKPMRKWEMNTIKIDKNTKGFINVHGLRLRAKPALNSKTIQYLKQWQKVSILKRSKKRMKLKNANEFWYQICAGNKTGWSYGQYISIYIKSH